MRSYVEYGPLILFCLAFAVPVYAYFLYPAILRLLVFFKEKEFRCSSNHLPKVAMIVSAYNEGRVIERKIRNCLSLDYAKEKLQIHIANDGSTDSTDEVVELFSSEGVQHHRVEGRIGKNASINHSWPTVDGDIIVFSDANSLYQRDAIRWLVRHFADERIGCVCGELRYIEAESGSAAGESLYWKYEQCLKKLQSRMGKVLVANGSIFAIRRKLFQPLEPKIANDFQIPAIIASQGYYIIYQPEAVAIEKVAASAQDEFGRKARIIARGFEGFFYQLKYFRGIRLFQLISQKFLRWNVWLAMITLFISNLFLLDYRFFQFVFGAQVVFYVLACLGPLLSRVNIPGIWIPYYFCLINLSALVGCWRFLFRSQKASWTPPRSAR